MAKFLLQLRYPVFVLLLCVGTSLQAQQLRLTLDEAIYMAADSSLSAIRAHSSSLSGYWEYRSFKAGRLPSLSLNLVPAQYNQNVVQRYDSEADRDEFRSQRSYYASGGLALTQNVDFLGGTLYMHSDLDYLRYMGADTYRQFSAVPVRLGYSQSLVGYNVFKWDKLIEPLKYQRRCKELVYDMESISEEVIGYFFALACAQAEQDLAKSNVITCDTLCAIGRERHRIAAISKADLLTLELDAVNARNTLKNADIALQKATFRLASFLGFEETRKLHVTLPERPSFTQIDAGEALAQARANNPQFIRQQQNILESEQTVDRTRKESNFNVSVNASVGLNQVGDNLSEVWQHPLSQNMVAVSVSVPLVDWGLRKGKYNMAKNNLNVVKTTARQTERDMEQEVIITVNDFNVQIDIIESAEEARRLAASAYEETRLRFMIGKTDITHLTLALNRMETAERNYIAALQNYWMNYYKIRRLTLFDFVSHKPLQHQVAP